MKLMCPVLFGLGTGEDGPSLPICPASVVGQREVRRSAGVRVS